MNKNSLIKKDDLIYRVLEIVDDKCLVINCIKRAMPFYISIDELKDFEEISLQDFLAFTNKTLRSIDSLSEEELKVAQFRYGSISLVLPVIADKALSIKAIKTCAINFNVSIETIRYRLYDYLIYGSITALAPYTSKDDKLTTDEKNFRWALNKFYYTSIKLSLSESYRRMIKDKYCDDNGNILEDIPSYRQFQYFFHKYNDKRKEIISRNGMGDFMRNHRALLGSGVEDYCPTIGYGMFDSTVCDIFLVNDKNELLGRPVLTACVDGFSHLCLGYSLGFVGGMESLRKLVENINTDKVSYCKKFGIDLDINNWNIKGLPHKFITDKGREYASETFSQLADLGIEIVNLPPYRPELKSNVEKFFDLVQSSYKKQLATKGVIFEDYQERGGTDYRKKACLTIKEFEKIVVLCIISYNSSSKVDLPYSLVGKVEPFACSIWNYEIEKYKNNIVEVDDEKLKLVLLPRTKGTFKRNGLIVNRIRYRNKDYMDRYLTNEDVVVAYDPNNVGTVWLIENGNYIEFKIIEEFFKEKTVEEVQEIITEKNKIEKSAERKSIQGSIDLYKEIDLITKGICNIDVDVKNVRDNRKKEVK